MEQVNSNVENIMNNSSSRKNLDNVHIMHSGDGKCMENLISDDNLYTNVQITSLSFPNIKIKQENQITYQNHDDNNYRNVKNISASSSDSSSPSSPSNSSTIINSNITTKMSINTQRTTRRQNISTPSLIRPSAAQMPSPDTSPCAPTLNYQHQMHPDILQIPLHTGRYCQYQQVIQPFTHIFPITYSTLPPYQHQQQEQQQQLPQPQQPQLTQTQTQMQTQPQQHIQANQLTLSSNVGEQNQYFLERSSIPSRNYPPPPPSPPQKQQQQQQERNLTAQTKSQSTIPDIECRKRKLERNRIAAKQCRERKKIYVAKLESKVTRLEEENAHLRRELEELNTRLQFNPVDAQERLRLHVLIEDLKSKVNNEIIKMDINQNKI